MHCISIVLRATMVILASSFTAVANNEVQLTTQSRNMLEARGIKVNSPDLRVASPRTDAPSSGKTSICRISASINLKDCGLVPKLINVSTSQNLPDASIIFKDSFEGDFPGTQWTLSGDPTWGKTNYKSHAGSNSVWCAASGGAALPTGSNYPANMNAIMIFGPFDLSDANFAHLSFYYDLDLESDRDWFFYLASTDGVTFHGIGESGLPPNAWYNDWRRGILSLSDVPVLGDVTGRPQVWIAFLLESDASNSYDKGVFIDEVELTKAKIEGTIVEGYASGVWSKKQNPYVVAGDVGVAENDSLIIEPGVKIYFTEFADEFIVQGYLRAVGTPADSIIFTSTAERWTGIGFYSDIQDGTSIAYSRIDKAGSGYHPDGGIYSESDKLIIKNCLIQSNLGAGVYCAANCEISDNTIQSNEMGIESYLCDPKIYRNLIRNNTTGIWMSVAEFPIIEENRITLNKSDGIITMDAAPRIINNFIDQNGGDGIDASAAIIGVKSGLIINGNKIISNSENGILLSGIAVFGGLTQNIISGNRWNGIRVPISSYASIKPALRIYNNTITKNRMKGLDFWDADLSSCLILGNIISNHLEAGIYTGKNNQSVSILNNDVYLNVPNFKVPGMDSLGIKTAHNENHIPCDLYQNISEDPLFVNSNTNDYRLKSVAEGFPNNSPCIDAGFSHPIYNDVNGGQNDIGYQGGGRLSLSATTLDFGDLFLGLSRSLEFAIHNDRDELLSIKQIRINNTTNFSFASNSTSDIPGYSSSWPKCKITFSPKESGQTAAELTIQSECFSGTNLVGINLNGRGQNGTLLAGTLSGQLQKNKNPYIITGNISVLAGNSLTIDPGVKIYFNGHYTFEVKGELRAVGIAKDSITFSHYCPDGKIPYNEIGEPLLWCGIRFTDASAKSQLAYCCIEKVSAPLNNFGGGIYCNNSTISIQNCLVQNCLGWWGAGIGLINSSNSQISNCTIKNNLSRMGYGGGLTIMDSSPLLSNNIIAGNNSEDNSWDGESGAIWISGSGTRVQLINNTIYNNYLPRKGYGNGILMKYEAKVESINNIFWGNGPTPIQVLSGSLSMQYCNIEGGFAGEGNIDKDPSFIDVDRSDFHLQSNSPCRDYGNPGFQFKDTDGSRNDMGAYGGPKAIDWTTSIEHSEKAGVVPEICSLAQNFPNPFNASTTFKFSINKPQEVKLEVFDIAGRSILIPFSGKVVAGEHQVVVDAAELPSGIYFMVLVGESKNVTRKMVIVK